MDSTRAPDAGAPPTAAVLDTTPLLAPAATLASVGMFVHSQMAAPPSTYSLRQMQVPPERDVSPEDRMLEQDAYPLALLIETNSRDFWARELKERPILEHVPRTTVEYMAACKRMWSVLEGMLEDDPEIAKESNMVLAVAYLPVMLGVPADLAAKVFAWRQLMMGYPVTMKPDQAPALSPYECMAFTLLMVAHERDTRQVESFIRDDIKKELRKGLGSKEEKIQQACAAGFAKTLACIKWWDLSF